VAELTEGLPTSLTSVIGMAKVLRQEIYGPLNHKQKEYLDVIYNSGEILESLAKEIINLGALNDNADRLQLAPVDIEMLCQQTVNILIPIAKQLHQELRLSVGPGVGIWLVDKEKISQSLYYLVMSILQSGVVPLTVRCSFTSQKKAIL